nr:immunoglobulin light chain junction region [Macaca mulatta]MOV65459.1 immunoglobulin light chain junction region [Macaca mulatta]
CYQYSSGYTF